MATVPVARVYDPATNTVTELSFPGQDDDKIAKAVNDAGLTLLGVLRVRRWISLSAVKERFTNSSFNVPIFCQELVTLLDAGMSLVESIETLLEKHASGDQTMHGIHAQLLRGKSFSTTLQESNSTFPPVLIAAIRASERSGRLAEALHEYLSYHEILSKLTRKLTSAALYPAVVICFGGLVSLFLLGFVVPRFAHIYHDVNQGLSGPTKVLIEFGSLVDRMGMWALAGPVLVLAVVIRMWTSASFKKHTLVLVRRIRSVQRLVRCYQLARIYQTVAMLIDGGYTVTDAIGLAQGFAFDTALRSGLLRAKVLIAEGRLLSTAFSENGLTDPVSVRLLRVGERSGNFGAILRAISMTHFVELETFIERVSRLAEPLLMIIVGGFIGAIVLLMYMPIFDLANQLQ